MKATPPALDDAVFRPLGEAEGPALQRLLERCADFEIFMRGAPPAAEAAQELLEACPAGHPLQKKLVFGLERDGETLIPRVETVRALVGGSVTDTAPPWWGAYPWQPGEIGMKVTCALSGLREVLAAAGPRVRGSAGVGVLYAVADEPDDVHRLREVAARHGGTVVVVDAPAEVKQAVDVWGPVPALNLMRRVKDQFDPDHRLAPGRFVGGI